MSRPVMAPFWMVYGIGQRAPTYRHATRGSAEAEAERLAERNPKVTFVVLEAKRAFVKRSVDVIDLDPEFAEVARAASVLDDDIPF